MPTRKKPVTRSNSSKKDPAVRQLAQLRKTVKELRVKLEREIKARQIEARVKTEAQKARAQLTLRRISAISTPWNRRLRLLKRNSAAWTRS